MNLLKKRTIISFITMIGMILTMIGCSTTTHTVTAKHKKQPISLKDKIEAMSMKEKIGQMIMIGIDGYTLDDQYKSLIQDNRIGGVIILGENVKDANQLVKLNNEIKKVNSSKSDIPIFISVDEEGGIVSRMPVEIKNLPNAKDIGDTQNVELATKVGRAIGERVKAFGFNIVNAPVMDINSNPKNPVIGVRSFGNNKEIVSKMGIAEMKSIQAEGIIPVIKHFPGHGDTSVDSHKGLPVVNNDLNILKGRELVPFKKAIDSGADVTMVAHILLPKIDPENPATFSKTIITDMLRTNLGFHGVVITDDMTMGAIAGNYDIGKAAVKSIQAGSDIILVCHGYGAKVNVINAINQAVKDGKISEDRINQSVTRILKLKAKYHLTDKPVENFTFANINKASDEINQSIQ
jgi:beta-N-acetylhexosaminidase